jgi:hypothetical protein
MNIDQNLIVQMQRFPLRFCKPIYFGSPFSKQNLVRVNNATATLTKINGKYIAITCVHVLKRYRDRRVCEKNMFFSIANCLLEPESQIMFEDVALDICVIELTESQASEILSDSEGIGESFYEVSKNHFGDVKIGDFVAFAGFPGEARKLMSGNKMSFGTYSSGSCMVTDMYSDYISCKFDRTHWVTNSYDFEPECIGGISGVPTFVICRTDQNILYYKFLGIVYNMHEATETLYVRLAESIIIFK